jgi:predicted O-linked N-acetylglucosamine transferase (SPINDLY family)/SAM-dependent methyltransferase
MPDHAPSLHHLGLIAFKRNELNSAVDSIRQSLAVQPDYHEAWLNLAIILGEANRSKEAIQACRQCLELQPHNAEAHAVLGNLLRVAQNDADAISAYGHALDLKPEQPIVLARLGELHLKSGDPAAAAEHCKRALELDPDLEEARNLESHLSVASRSVATLLAEAEARSASSAAFAKTCDEFAAHLRQERRYADAMELSRHSISADASVGDYHFNLALALEALGYSEAALASYQAGLALEPDRADVYASVGTLLRNMSMLNGAVQALEYAVELDPTLGGAHYSLAITHKLRENYDAAIASFQRCVECEPDAIVNRLEYVNLRRTLCDWDGVDEEERACLEIFRSKSAKISPFQLVSLSATPLDQLRAAKGYVQTFNVSDSVRFEEHRSRLGVGQRIRLGFVSCDYFEHATAMLFAEVLEKLDRNRFEVFGYCHSPDDTSTMRKRILSAFEHVRKIGAMRNREAAEVIRDDAIDILVDLKGYTRDARSEIFAFRPAPIQVNYLGYPGTMGADFIDYIIADAIVAPMEAQDHYSERIVHMPHSYQPNDRQRVISDKPVSRSDYGLPEGAFVFCSFNNSYKLNSAMFDIWMSLLQKVAGSVLWLLVPNEKCADNLRREAAARGVDSSRLVFAERASIANHLARHRLADLFLDALPCNAHTTTSDALWAGLPVLTCLGNTFAGRVAGSLLTAMDLPELVTANLGDYSRLALELANDDEKLGAIRTKLISNRETAPLYDSTRYTRNLERSFETMVEIQRSGQTPRPFVVVETDTRQPAPLPSPPRSITSSPRALFEGCPLCESRSVVPESEARITNHPLYNTILPPVLKWCRCTACDHVFSEGYLTPAGLEILHSSANREATVGNDAENGRKNVAKLVSRVASHVREGNWLDIGVGNASRVFTAAEWGFRAMGIDANESNVAKLKRFGFDAYRTLEELSAEARFDVISMIDTFDQIPYPARTLATAHRIMRPGGVLVLSLPNRDTIVWRALEATNTNSYWADIERYHVFTRAGLVSLLKANGFELAEYGVAENQRSAMDILARKSPAT